ncbi:uncharacterized protein LOC130753064 isoform X1 [Actinidia eriantha]|uniref:uncharacterized protein LOC130753064 isoform X1 n=1 Tax=Actinidia eriantha TaxID=165200 RepID=UPI002583F8DF|nr:uncharacterized protein LOC130753064 isoform X1 [Actinidia eriantha]XP_057462974.1 uncharacterized protein LOC130753064 isoform X1 [Actinidia eriantha]
MLLFKESIFIRQWFCSVTAEGVAGSAAWLGRGLSCVCAQSTKCDARLSFDLTPAQEECLQRLQNRIAVPSDSSNAKHQEASRALSYAAFLEELRGLVSEQWEEMDWQGKDPSTDFRLYIHKVGSENDDMSAILRRLSFWIKFQIFDLF